MKLDFSLNVCYFLYFGIAIFLNPARHSSTGLLSRSNVEVAVKMEKPFEVENADILHSELLFKY